MIFFTSPAELTQASGALIDYIAGTVCKPRSHTVLYHTSHSNLTQAWLIGAFIVHRGGHALQLTIVHTVQSLIDVGGIFSSQQFGNFCGVQIVFGRHCLVPDQHAQ